jgi:hypothetical protein
MLLVNHKYKAIFLHNPKVAGTYLKTILKTYYNFENICYNKSIKEHLEFIENENLNLIENNNIKICQIRNKGIARYFESVLKDPLYKDYYKFVFVRNPYNKIISAWSYSTNFSKNDNNIFLKKNNNNNISFNYDNNENNNYEIYNEMIKTLNYEYKHEDDYTFDEYLVNASSTCSDYAYFHSFITQTDMLINNDNKIDFNFIGKYENLNEDLLTVLKNIGITEHIHIGTEEDTPKNVSKYKNPISDYLTPENITIINKLFEKDFINFNYEMKKGI